MNTISVITTSSVLMYIFAFVFTISCLGCIIVGIKNHEFPTKRIIYIALFAIIAILLYWYASSITARNPIDKFVFDTWKELKLLTKFIKAKFL